MVNSRTKNLLFTASAWRQSKVFLLCVFQQEYLSCNGTAQQYNKITGCQSLLSVGRMKYMTVDNIQQRRGRKNLCKIYILLSFTFIKLAQYLL